jgi:hypothetical protein
MRRIRIHSRRGSLYTGVLLVSLMVAMIGLASLQIAHVTLRQATDSNTAPSAQILARSAVEFAVLQLRSDPNWRTTYSHNTTYPTSGRIPLGAGTFTFRFLDADGNLADDDSDAVRVWGIANVGEATWAESVLLLPTGSGVSALQSSIYSGGNISIASGACVETNHRIGASGAISVSSTQSLLVAKYIDAGSTISGNAAGLTSTSVAARKMPSDTVFDYYLARGVFIDVSSLPTSNGAKRLGEIVLGPNVNPFGIASPEGIYVLDCKNQKINITDSRILGTLVILDPGADSTITEQVSITPAISNYPSLLVRGNLKFAFESDAFLRETTEGVNFNPSGAPDNGAVDSDTSDSYASLIRGLVYVSGALEAPSDSQTSVTDGVLLAGSMSFSSNHRARYSPLFSASPPPGFARGNPMVIAPGTWRRETAPVDGTGLDGEITGL